MAGREGGRAADDVKSDYKNGPAHDKVAEHKESFVNIRKYCYFWILTFIMAIASHFLASRRS